MTKGEEMSGVRFWIFNTMPLKNRSVCIGLKFGPLLIMSANVNPIHIVTSKMRFTNNRLTSLQADKTLLGSIRLCRAQLNEKI